MARAGSGTTYTTATTEGAATAIELKPRGGFFVAVPTDSSITTITVYAQATAGTEYVPCGDAQTGTAPYGFTFVDAFGAKAFKLVANAAGTVYVGLSD